MQAAPTPIISFFNGFKQYVIPLFQRGYSWEAKNWKQLWEDIEMLMDSDAHFGSAHFLGAVVTSPTVSVPVGVSKHMVIDGQQRLTTLAILLCAIRDALPEGNVLADRISRHYLLNDGYQGTDFVKVLPTQRDRAEFINLCTEAKLGSGRISDAYGFFMKRLEKGQDLAEKTLTIIERQLQVVAISLDDSEDPYTIFESLNFKGSPLTQVDLARNYFLMRFEVNQQEAVYRDHWLPTQERLEEQHMPRYLRQHLRMHGEEVRKPDVYAALRRRLSEKSSDEVRDYLAHFERLSRRFAHLVGAADDGNPELVARLRWLNEWEIGVADPLILQILDDVDEGLITEKDAIACMKTIESFAVRREVCGVPTNQLRRLFLGICKSRPRGARADALATSLTSGTRGARWPDDEEFAGGWKTYRAYAKPRRCRLLLIALEKSFDHREAPSVEQATIEHIMPQTLTPWWEDHLGERSGEYQAQVGDTIGNLTLSAYNSKLSNKPYAEKIKLLQDSNFELNKRLPKDAWRGLELRTRAEFLAKRACELWPR